MYSLPQDLAPPDFVRQRSKSIPPIRGGDAMPLMMFRGQSIYLLPVSSGLRWDNASSPKSSIMPRRPKRTFDEPNGLPDHFNDHSHETGRYSSPAMAPSPPRFVRRKTPDSDSDWIALALCGNERVMEELNRPPRVTSKHPRRRSATGGSRNSFTGHAIIQGQSTLHKPQLFWFLIHRDLSGSLRDGRDAIDIELSRANELIKNEEMRRGAPATATAKQRPLGHLCNISRQTWYHCIKSLCFANGLHRHYLSCCFHCFPRAVE